MSSKYLRKYKLKIIYKIKYTIHLTKLMIKKNNAKNFIGTKVLLWRRCWFWKRQKSSLVYFKCLFCVKHMKRKRFWTEIRCKHNSHCKKIKISTFTLLNSHTLFSVLVWPHMYIVIFIIPQWFQKYCPVSKSKSIFDCQKFHIW